MGRKHRGEQPLSIVAVPDEIQEKLENTVRNNDIDDLELGRRVHIGMNVIRPHKIQHTGFKALTDAVDDVRSGALADNENLVIVMTVEDGELLGVADDAGPAAAQSKKTFRTQTDYFHGDATMLRCEMGALDVLCDMIRFYQREAEEKAASAPTAERRKEMTDLATALRQLPDSAPSSLLSAMQLCWLYGVMCPLVEFGRMDEYLGDLYCHDIDSGVITEAQALKMAQTYFHLIDALDDETDGRVIVGGYGRRNPKNADRYCLVACEACRTVKEILPQFTLRFNRDTPQAVWEAAMRCIGEGRTFPLLYNDDVLVPSVMKAFQVDRARAETYMPLGCGEIEFDHYSFGSPNGSVGTLKILELAVRGGYDPIAGDYLAPRTIPLTECKSYEQFVENYKTLLHYFIAAQAHYEKYLYESIGRLHPFMMVSMLYDGCMESGKGLLNGGCQYLAGTMELYGNVNAANSLAAIKKLVFEEKTSSAQELTQALDDNFVGHERLRRKLLDAPKYGNDIAYVDDIMVELHDWLCETTSRQAEKVGLKSYLCVNINNAQNTTLGRWVGATPDGRKVGTPMANANIPSSGTDKNGLTAMLNSILKLRHDNHAGMVQNLRFTRETWYNPDGKARALLDDYFARGGRPRDGHGGRAGGLGQGDGAPRRLPGPDCAHRRPVGEVRGAEEGRPTGDL